MSKYSLQHSTCVLPLTREMKSYARAFWSSSWQGIVVVYYFDMSDRWPNSELKYWNTVPCTLIQFVFWFHELLICIRRSAFVSSCHRKAASLRRAVPGATAGWGGVEWENRTQVWRHDTPLECRSGDNHSVILVSILPDTNSLFIASLIVKQTHCHANWPWCLSVKAFCFCESGGG